MRSIVILGSQTESDRSLWAIFSSSQEDLITNEDQAYLTSKLPGATIVYGPLHKALILADHEADYISEGPELPPIIVHRLGTCKISQDCLSIETL